MMSQSGLRESPGMADTLADTLFRPVPATLVYLFRDDDHVLLMQRNKKPGDTHEGMYVGLGGKLHSGESPADCALREVREESGLKVDETSLVFRGHLNCPEFDRSGRDWMVFVYTACRFSGRLITDCPEGRLVWVPVSRVADLPMWEGDYRFFPLLTSGGGELFDMTVRYQERRLSECRMRILNAGHQSGAANQSGVSSG